MDSFVVKASKKLSGFGLEENTVKVVETLPQTLGPYIGETTDRMVGSVLGYYVDHTLGMRLPVSEMHPVVVLMDREEGNEECRPRQIPG